MYVHVQIYEHVITILVNLKEPTGYPYELRIISQTSTMVKFQWKELECYEQNGPITGYHYRIYHDNSSYNEGITDNNSTMYTLVVRNIQYFSVAAMNKAGIGPHCPPIPVPRFHKGWCKISQKYGLHLMRYMSSFTFLF